MQKLSHLFQKISQDKYWLTLPNVLTFMRIALAPVVVIGMSMGCLRFSFTVFVLAAMTDLFDGLLARWCNVQTHLGKIVDPIADKLLLVSSFCALAFLPSPLFPIPVWFFVIIFAREIVIILGSWVVLRLNPQTPFEPIIWGKLTTFFQILFIIWMFTCYFVGWEPRRTYGIFLVLLAFFSLLSLLQYIKIGWLYVRQELKN